MSGIEILTSLLIFAQELLDKLSWSSINGIYDFLMPSIIQAEWIILLPKILEGKYGPSMNIRVFCQVKNTCEFSSQYFGMGKKCLK